MTNAQRKRIRIRTATAFITLFMDEMKKNQIAIERQILQILLN